MKKEILCPKCKTDLVKEGFHSYEEVLMRYYWDWNAKRQWFDSDEGQVREGDNESQFCCNSCEEEITDFVREKELV